MAPDKIDPRLLDPKSVFSDEGLTVAKVHNIFHPEKQVRQRDGYDTQTLHKTTSVMDYLRSADATVFLGSWDALGVDSEVQRLQQCSPSDSDFETIKENVKALKKVLAHPKTTVEVLECIKDLRVLGKREFKLLIQWRKLMRGEALGLGKTEEKSLIPSFLVVIFRYVSV